MEIPRSELNSVLAQFNPWWRGEKTPDLPGWRRAVFQELLTWVAEPPAPRAVLLSGVRQVGKTTLLLQVIQSLLEDGVSASNIIYVTFDHPLIKLAGIEAVLEAWREKEVVSAGAEYLFLDEAQFMPNWGTWIKHQVDFGKRRMTFTGSALPLIDAEIESNVGRTHAIRIATLSFYEYLQLKEVERPKSINFNLLGKNFEHPVISDISDKIKKEISMEGKDKVLSNVFKLLTESAPKELPKLPDINSLEQMFDWTSSQFSKISALAIPYTAHFNEYLARGGFPQTAKVSSITRAQSLLREDIVDKVLKRDMTALFGVRRIQELEQTFLYLCMHDGGQLNMETLTGNLGVKKPTAKKFIELLEATHLIYRLSRFGYGKEVLRGKEKVYLADAAIAPAVFLKGKSFLEDSKEYGLAIETTAFKHLYAHYPNTARLTYWLGKKKHEVDVIAEQGGKYIPFEIKQEKKADIRDCRGLLEFCQEKNVELAYVVTKTMSDFGLLEQKIAPQTRVLRIPAPLFCYWLGASELEKKNS
ncbi:MAG: ATPase [Gammaproteobacteria bacterium CG11_big_fil_rev_8_21_14_0_20_46_22]|nr:MAG: ATPase [Gammaproteobacteria bacterium CG12_big_fil_rev_8_21_14_0_65_46_12]PIR11251.1 MAG: ATPase [Gammaproteobacteria bacterium CG11_big_fil_rev_8_21_14_0_20_46_22]